jgi:polyisoprenoid-binding protein YceI
MSMLKAHVLVALALVSTVGLAACEDPAQNAPKATVSSAKPLAPSSAAASAKPAAAPSGDASAAPAAASAAPVADAAPAKPANAIDISEATSKVEWVGSKVTGKHDGSFQKFTGWIGLPSDKPEEATIHVSIDVASVKSDDEKLTGHLKTDDFFAVDKNPTATFTSTEIKAGGDKGATHTITGNLKLRGVEKSVSFPATVKVDAKEVTAKAEFAINRKDFGIAYEGKKDDLIRDEVVIKLDIKGARPAK